MRLRLASVASLSLVLATFASEPHARAADPNEGGAAAAESLFQDARRLMDAKKYAEACPKFLASYKLGPGVGTLLNLADCYEKEGKLASAWARFHEAIALAQRLGRPDREKTAKERADKLEPRLARLTILSQEKDVNVTLDGNALDPAVLGTPLPIDPGKHTLEASAKGKKPYTTTIDVGDRVKSRSVEIPSLEAEPEAAKTAEPPKKTTPGEPDKPPPSDGSTQRTLGLVGMGVGVVGLGVGAFFGLRTSSKWNDAKSHCTNGECDRDGVQLATDAKNAGNISTIAFIAGGVFVAGGAALFFTAPGGMGSTGRTTKRVQVGVGPGNVVVGGRF